MIIKEYPEANFVWLGATGPYRWLSVSWEPGIHSEWLTPNGLFNRRNEIGGLYQEVQTNREYLGHRYTEFNQLQALQMTGVWHHTQEAKGGPFITYAFYDPDSDRSFMIDMLMFAPGEKHSVFLRQLEIMAKTFSTTRNPKDASS